MRKEEENRVVRWAVVRGFHERTASGVSPSSSGSALEATRTDKSDIMLQTTPTDPAALARRPGTAGPLAVATPTTRRLADASISRNTRRAYAGYRRTAADRGRGQAAPLSADGLAAILATAARPRTDGRGVESHTTAQRRGPTRRRDRLAVVHGRAAAVGSERA